MAALAPTVAFRFRTALVPGPKIANAGLPARRVMKQMHRANLNGIELEYEVRGAGEPVVLVHWGVSAKWAEPLLEAPALSDGYLLLKATSCQVV